MVNLRHCQARLDPERDARCNLEIGRNQLFCRAHNAECNAVAERGDAAAMVLEDLGRSVDALVAGDVSTYASYEDIQRDQRELGQYLQALDDRVEARDVLRRRFLTEARRHAIDAILDDGRRKMAVATALQRFEARRLAIHEDARRKGVDERLEEVDADVEQGHSGTVGPRDEAQRADAEREREQGVQTGRREDSVLRDVLVPSGAVEAVCDEEPETVPEAEAQANSEADAVERDDRSAEPEDAPHQQSTAPSQDGETEEEARGRREQVKHQIKVLNEYRRRKAERASMQNEESREPLQTETASAGGSSGSGPSGLEFAGRVALTCTVVGIALFLGVRNRDAIVRLSEKCMGK